MDDHPMVLNGLRQVLSLHSELALAGEAATGAEALKLTRELNPDLVVMDIHLPDMNGIETTRQILAAQPAAKIIIYSGDPSRANVDEAIRAGARGYLFKRGIIAELFKAIDVVMTGELYLSPEVSLGIVEDYHKRMTSEAAPAKQVLSVLETKLLRLVAAGQRNKEIAVQLAISIKSVEAYRSRLIKKLGCASSADLIRYAIREGIAAP
ncbi:MAG: response regulator transcription factor [Verrucomicrobiae bacterium]|nr:response regulator transcription factor [Verrucomicrobiae bacterium]